MQFNLPPNVTITRTTLSGQTATFSIKALSDEKYTDGQWRAYVTGAGMGGWVVLDAEDCAFIAAQVAADVPAFIHLLVRMMAMFTLGEVAAQDIPVLLRGYAHVKGAAV